MRVLLIEDDLKVGNTLKVGLESEGYTAVLARSGEDTSLESSEGVGKLSHAVSTDVALTSQARSLCAELLCLSHCRLLDGAHVVFDF